MVCAYAVAGISYALLYELDRSRAKLLNRPNMCIWTVGDCWKAGFVTFVDVKAREE